MSPIALAGPIDPERYRLGPGDRLVVQWSGRVTRAQYVDVGPAGDLFLAEVGSVTVAGQTLAAARKLILDRLRSVTRDVRIEVQLARPRFFRVFLGGAVSDPGPAQVVGDARVSDVLRASRMLAGASRRNIRVIHRDGTEDTADIERLLRLGDHSRDIVLRDGDAVVVPLAVEFVVASGAVRLPGTIERAPGDSASTLLRLAGGPLPAAAPDDGIWIHWGTAAGPETLRVSVHGLLEGTAGGALANGDRLFIRFIPNFHASGEVELLGQVARPGGYPVALGGTRLSEVIAAGGGFLPTAELSGILITRPSAAPADSQPELVNRIQATQRDLSVSDYEALQASLASRAEEFRVDWSDVLKHPRASDPLLRDGDVVTVRRRVASIRIDGQVGRPGALTYDSRTSLSEYIRQAGGFTARAWRGHEQVTRAGTGHTLLARNVRALSPGDFIWVPTRPENPIWRRSTELLAALAQVATVVIAIRGLK